jgi:hypothetical protein
MFLLIPERPLSPRDVLFCNFQSSELKVNIHCDGCLKNVKKILGAHVMTFVGCLGR